MMDLNEFAEYVKNNIEDYLMRYDIEKIDINRVTKTNGVVRTGMVVLHAGERIGPNIYLEEFHAAYENGADMEDILQEISNAYMDARERMFQSGYAGISADNMDASGLFLKAVNYHKNRERLQDIIYERHMDLALEVRIFFGDDEDGFASAPVTYGMLENFGMSRTEVFERAKENTPELFPVQFDTLLNILKSKGMIDADMEEMMPAVYVLTNSRNVNGAAYIAYGDVIAELLQKHNITENVYILPSSVHELLLIPARGGMDERELQMMVQDVNRCEVRPEEYLSDNIYRYDAREKSISQITDVQQDQNREDEMAIQEEIDEMYERENNLNQTSEKGGLTDNRYYNFKDAVEEAEKIIGENGRLESTDGTIWDCFNLSDYNDSRPDGGDAYWCVGWEGSIGYTEDNGYNVRWDYQKVEEQTREVKDRDAEEFER